MAHRLLWPRPTVSTLLYTLIVEFTEGAFGSCICSNFVCNNESPRTALLPRCQIVGKT